MLGRRTEKLYVAALGLFGLLLESRPIGDNSMLTHLRTGMTIAHGGGIPRRDPYSYTAFHHAWVVQSWLAEASYGWLQRIGGLHLVVVEQAVLAGALAVTIAWLARTGRAATTALAGFLAVCMGSGYWAPRPLLFGLLGLALTIAITEGQCSPWWIVPVVWVWVSTHGSFPLGLAWLVASLAGEAIDTRGVLSVHRLRCLGAFAVGLVVSVANPLGPKLLLFPLTVQRKQAVFKDIVEWRSPNFQTGPGLVALVCLIAAVAIIAGRRAPWRHVVPAAAFVGLGLYASRNLAAAAIVLAPALASALRGAPAEAAEGADEGAREGVAGEGAVPESDAVPESRSPVGVMRSDSGSGGLDRIFAALIAAVAVAAVVTAMRRPPLKLSEFPVAAVTWTEQAGLRGPAHHLLSTDIVGNYLDYRYGNDARVFVDDRYDMFPTKVANDFKTVFFARPGALEVLDRYRVDVVIWRRSEPFAGLIAASGHWRGVHDDGPWTVYTRT